MTKGLPVRSESLPRIGEETAHEKLYKAQARGMAVRLKPISSAFKRIKALDELPNENRIFATMKILNKALLDLPRSDFNCSFLAKLVDKD